jgi:leader peptidase (prepilin peptidase)/N-methyltransferase
MTILEYLQAYPAGFFVVSAVMGLIVGSFLNVVILRLPAMMERDWRSRCQEVLEGPGPGAQETEPFNLVRPGSHCPACGHGITALENIPVISYLWLRGKCSACGARISPRYPTVEIVSAALAVAVAWRFGVTPQAAGAMLLTWALVALAVIDLDHHLLPDDITLPFLWLGLVFNLFGTYTTVQSSLIGAMAGYVTLWVVYQLFRLATGKEGMGYGDFKLLAMLGAWLGWQALPAVILLSSVVGAAVGITLILLRGHDRNIPIPFGPYIAAAGWIALLWGERLTQTYLALATHP